MVSVSAILMRRIATRLLVVLDGVKKQRFFAVGSDAELAPGKLISRSCPIRCQVGRLDTVDESIFHARHSR